MFNEIEFDVPQVCGFNCRRFRAERMLLDVCFSNSGALQEFEYCVLGEGRCYVITWSRSNGQQLFQVAARNAFKGMTEPRVPLESKGDLYVDPRKSFLKNSASLDASITVEIASRLPRMPPFDTVELARCG